MERVVGSLMWLERLKFPDAPHYRVEGRYLGQDEHGSWAGAMPGHPVVKGNGETFRGRQTIVWLVPHDGWFMAHFLRDHERMAIYIDIATPATWTDVGSRVIDLDLDVVVWHPHDGRGVQLVDEDEFDAHQVELGYPAELIEGARRSGAEVLAQATAGAAPFSRSVAEPWFEALDALPALPTLPAS